MNIDTETKIDDLTFIKHLKMRNSPFLAKIKETYDCVKDILNSRVQHVFPNYTLHNTGHSFRIMEYMSQLVADYKDLNDLEISLLIYSALLHDIGMAVSDEDIQAIKSDTFTFCDVKFSAMKKMVGDDSDLALQEFVRRIHASLSGRYIREHLRDKLVIPNLTSLDFVDELSLICESHTQEHDWIISNLRSHEVRGDNSFNPQFIAAILRLADLLDIDGNRTPYNLYEMIAPKGVSNEEWRQNFVISNTDKVVFNEATKQKRIVFHGKADSASVHRKLLVYIGWVHEELINTTSLVKVMPDRYRMVYETTPEINIQTHGYTFSDYKMTMEFKAITSLLMGEKIYGSKSLGLRELIQNSIDSCRIRQEAEKLRREFGEDPYQPKIKVILDEEKNEVVVKDNGTGMSLDIIKKHFLNIGVSYYASKDFQLKDYEYKPIGNFGIGFLSCFMLSDEVKVITRHYKSKNKYLIELEMGNEYTSLTVTEDVEYQGTEVVLKYSNFLNAFENKMERVKDLLSLYFLTDGITLELINKGTQEVTTIDNPISLSFPLEKGIMVVSFKDYLKDIDGYALIRVKHDFIRSFEEIDFRGDLYIYTDEEQLVHVGDYADLKIDDYISDCELRYIAVPLVTASNKRDYLNGMRFTGDDVSEVIEKMESDLSWISVLLPKEYPQHIYPETLSDGDFVSELFSFEDLVKLGHSEECETKTFIRKVILFEGKKNDVYMPFDVVSHEDSWYRSFDEERQLFLRGVLLKEYSYIIPVIATIFEVKTIIANVNSRKIIPNIARNSLGANERKQLNYVIGKAVHVGAYNMLSLGDEEKVTLRKFIKTYYAETTEYELSTGRYFPDI